MATVVAISLVGCDATTREEGLAPETPSVADTATPLTTTVATAPVTSDAITIVGLTLAPVSATLSPGETVSFSPLGWLPGDNTPISASVTWTATGGTITSAGVYTAGAVAGTYEVMARSTTTGHYEAAVITIKAAPSAPVINTVVVSPGSLTIAPGAKQQFTASAALSNGTTQTTPAVTWIASGGSISTTGLYTAPLTAGSYLVIAASSNGKADTSSVTVGAAQRIVGLTLKPTSASLAPGASITFTPEGWLPGANTPITASVTWTATGGTITSAGVYTAGSVPGTYRVLASSTTTGHTEPATVTITGSVPVATIVSVSLTPASVSLAPSGKQQFAVSAGMSNGTTQANPSVTWSATGGTVSSTGLYSAGTTAGSYRVIALSTNGKADTSGVTITAVAATLTTLSLSPSSFALAEGATKQLSVAATWSNGGTTVPAVTYAATGGTVSGSGLYTAGSTAGTYRVISTALGKADTSAVTVTAAPVTPPPSGGSHEPSGYSVISDQPFSSLTAAGWGVESGNPTLVSDGSGPKSPGSLVRATYNAGYRAGSAPWTMEHGLPGTTKLYIALTYRLSSNFQGENSGTNKMGFIWIHNNPAVFFSNEGAGSGNLVSTMRLQNTADSREYLKPNMGPSGVVSRGSWHTWEVELISNSGGGANGTVRWWLDGTLVGQYTDVKFASASQGRTFDISSIYPIWGGVAGTVSSSMSIDFDHIRISGSN